MRAGTREGPRRAASSITILSEGPPAVPNALGDRRVVFMLASRPNGGRPRLRHRRSESRSRRRLRPPFHTRAASKRSDGWWTGLPDPARTTRWLRCSRKPRPRRGRQGSRATKLMPSWRPTTRSVGPDHLRPYDRLSRSQLGRHRATGLKLVAPLALPVTYPKRAYTDRANSLPLRPPQAPCGEC